MVTDANGSKTTKLLLLDSLLQERLISNILVRGFVAVLNPFASVQKI